ncbi:hypothetical protein RSO41_04525, partial [Halomonas sp. I1]|uniref:hypothetical protein n=1 Tax=Halomonas sp. I1 TaxID=393536 RepID=UPI0028DE53DD
MYIEQQDSLSLKLVNEAYAVETSQGDVVLTRPSGRAFGLNDNFEFTHAEPTSDGGFAAVMQFKDGQVSLRWFDGNGHLEQWTDKAPAAEYADRESELGLDIDGDGEVSRSQYVEQQGNLSLKVVDGAYAVETVSGDVVLTRPSGRAFGLNDNFDFTHAEPTSDGGFVAVMQFKGGQVSLRWFDGNGHLEQWTDKAPAAEYADRESELGLDIDGDGEV